MDWYWAGTVCYVFAAICMGVIYYASICSSIPDQPARRLSWTLALAAAAALMFVKAVMLEPAFSPGPYPWSDSLFDVIDGWSLAVAAAIFLAFGYVQWSTSIDCGVESRGELALAAAMAMVPLCAVPDKLDLGVAVPIIGACVVAALVVTQVPERNSVLCDDEEGEYGEDAEAGESAREGESSAKSSPAWNILLAKAEQGRDGDEPVRVTTPLIAKVTTHDAEAASRDAAEGEAGTEAGGASVEAGRAVYAEADGANVGEAGTEAVGANVETGGANAGADTEADGTASAGLAGADAEANGASARTGVEMGETADAEADGAAARTEGVAARSVHRWPLALLGVAVLASFVAMIVFAGDAFWKDRAPRVDLDITDVQERFNAETVSCEVPYVVIERDVERSGGEAVSATYWVAVDEGAADIMPLDSSLRAQLKAEDGLESGSNVTLNICDADCLPELFDSPVESTEAQRILDDHLLSTSF